MRLKWALIILWACAFGRLGYDRLRGTGGSGVPPLRPLTEFPREAWPGQIGVDVPLEERVREKAAVTEYINREYRRESSKFYFYVGYYSGSTVESIHDPDICFPSAGWKTAELEMVTLRPADGAGTYGRPMVFNLRTFAKENRRRLTAYTFYYNGVYEPDRDSIYRGRAFSSRYYAVLNVTVDLGGSMNLKRARELLEDLITKAVPRLDEFFPGGRSQPSAETTTEKKK